MQHNQSLMLHCHQSHDVIGIPTEHLHRWWTAESLLLVPPGAGFPGDTGTFPPS